MSDRITYCDIMESCKECPRYGKDCDGDKRIETTTLNEKHQLSAETPTDLISRADAIEAVRGLFDMRRRRAKEIVACIESAFEALPSAEAVQGEWICKDSDDMSVFWYECSICGEKPPKDQFNHEWKSNFCPNCGAKMNKGGDEE